MRDAVTQAHAELRREPDGTVLAAADGTKENSARGSMKELGMDLAILNASAALPGSGIGGSIVPSEGLAQPGRPAAGIRR